MTWNMKMLRDCATFSSGGTPNKGKPEFWNGDIPWVSSGEMSKQFIDDTTLHISQAGAEIGSRMVPAGTIFTVVRGMSLATEFRVSYAMREMAFNQDVKALIVKPGLDPYFFFCSLRAHSEQIRSLATEAAHGTKKMEMERLESFCIPVPDLDIQRRAAAVVKAYDDLIETNRRRIALLEESARLLYREWFVQLRFPGHESVPVKGGVPKGWQLATLNEALFLQRGFDLPNGTRIAGDVPVYASAGLNGFHNQAKVKGPGVVTGRSGTLGVVHYVAQDFWPLNTSLWVKEFRGASPLLAYFILSELHLVQFNSGASVPTLDRKVAHQLPVLIPAQSVVAGFDAQVQPLFDQIHTLKAANDATARARDALLPQLMSGQLDVSSLSLPEAVAS